MTKKTKSGALCRFVSWLIGIGAGGYLAYYLVNELGQDRAQSAVIGIVTMLITGLLMRGLFCRGRSVKAEVAPAKAEEPAARPEKAPVPRKPEAERRQETRRPEAIRTAKPVAAEAGAVRVDVKASEIDRKLSEIVSAAAAEIAAQPVEAKLAKAAAIDAELEKQIDLDSPAPAPVLENVVKLEPLRPVPVVEMDAGDEVEEIEEVDETAFEDEVVQAKPVVAAAPAAERPATGTDAPAEADDLTQIEGVGPEQANALHAAGIHSFADFVAMNKRDLTWIDENIPGAEAETGTTWRRQAIALSRQAN